MYGSESEKLLGDTIGGHISRCKENVRMEKGKFYQSKSGSRVRPQAPVKSQKPVYLKAATAMFVAALVLFVTVA